MDKLVILSGNKGNLGPIWEDFLTRNGAMVYGFDWDKSKPTGLTNANVRDMNSLYDFRMIYYDHLRDNFEKSPGKHRSSDCVPDIIINNAAIDTPPGKNNGGDMKENVGFFTDYEGIIDTNLIGAINLTSLFIDAMATREKGLIVNIGSILGNVAADTRNYPPEFEKPVGYNVSKSGLVQYTRSLAVQFGPKNIRSICISFAAVDTGKFDEPFKSKFLKCLPLRRFISKKSLCSTLQFAIETPEASGSQVLVDAGYTAW